MGASASKSGNHNESLGLMPSKNIYISVLVAHKSLQVCSGPMGPVILKNSLTQTPKQSDPCPRYPHNMSLQGGRQVLYLCHGNCASERSEVPLNPPKNPLSLSLLGGSLPLLLPRRRQLRPLAMGGACSVHNRQVAQVPHLHAIQCSPIKKSVIQKT
jgi:hypothetical protein